MQPVLRYEEDQLTIREIVVPTIGWSRSGARRCRSSAAPFTIGATCLAMPQSRCPGLAEDYRDTIHADPAAGIEKRRKAFLRKWHLKCRAVANSLEEAGDRSCREGGGNSKVA